MQHTWQQPREKHCDGTRGQGQKVIAGDKLPSQSDSGQAGEAPAARNSRAADNAMSRSLVLILLLALASLELLQARSLPDRPHRRYIRRRVSPTNPDVEIVEVRDVYFIQRPKKVVTTIDEDELDWRIRCDFNPSLDECKGLGKKPVASASTTTKATTTTTTPGPPTTATTPEAILDDCDFNPTLEKCAPSTTSTTSTTTTTTTTTTELPLVSESTEPEPEYDEEPEEETESQPEPETQTETQTEQEEADYEAQPNPEENIELEEDNGDDDVDGDEDEPEDTDDDDTDTNNEEGSSFIGFNDQSEWN